MQWRDLVELLQDPIAELIIWLAALAILLAIAVYIISKLREDIQHDEPIASQVLSNFRELYNKGKLSEEEFQTIKTVVTEQLQREVLRKESPTSNRQTSPRESQPTDERQE